MANVIELLDNMDQGTHSSSEVKLISTSPCHHHSRPHPTIPVSSADPDKPLQDKIVDTNGTGNAFAGFLSALFLETLSKRTLRSGIALGDGIYFAFENHVQTTLHNTDGNSVSNETSDLQPSSMGTRHSLSSILSCCSPATGEISLLKSVRIYFPFIEYIVNPFSIFLCFFLNHSMSGYD